jgi:putative iron-regulated protein
VQRRTRIWIGLGTALLVGATGVERVSAITRETTVGAPTKHSESGATVSVERPLLVAQAEDPSGEGGPGEGGGPVLGTITEFRLSSTDPDAFNYDAKAQVGAYVELVVSTYGATLQAATELKDTIAALAGDPTASNLDAARSAWLDTRAAYLRSEAFLFYAGPVDGPGGPFPRLNGWPVEPAMIDGVLADTAQSLNLRAIARLNSVETPVKITTGLHVLEYLLWGLGGNSTIGADAFAGDAGARRADYAKALAQLFVNDLTVISAAWAPGTNNYRASVEAMDQRNALGRAINGMTALLGYEVPLRRIGAGLFPANENFQPSRFSRTSADDLRFAFEGARAVYEQGNLATLVEDVDPDLAAKIAEGFTTAAAATAALDAPYERFLAPPAGSAERATAQAAVKALTNLARDLRQAGNRLGILVVVPGM